VSEVVNSSTLLTDIRFARDGMLNASEWARQTAVDLPRAKSEYESAYARAFVLHKEAGATDALAKEKAKIDTETLRSRYYACDEENQVAKAELRSWGSLFEAYRSISYVSSQEMKMGDGF
jgi:hypothetical protein